jgi:hypothetical protein
MITEKYLSLLSKDNDIERLRRCGVKDTVETALACLLGEQIRQEETLRVLRMLRVSKD